MLSKRQKNIADQLVRATAVERLSQIGAVPGREINAMRQPPMEYPPAFIVAAQRARAAQPPMMSMCGRLEGWDG